MPAALEVFLGFIIDTVEQTVSVAPKRVNKMNSWLETHQPNRSMPTRDLLRFLGMIVSTCQIFPRFHLYIGEVFLLVAGNKFTQPIVIPPAQWNQLVSVVREITNTRFRYNFTSPIDWCVIGDAVPDKAGAELYSGLPPYAAPTSAPGELIDQAVTEQIPPELTTIAEVECWTLLWAACVWLPMFTRGQWLALIGDNQVAIAGCSGPGPPVLAGV